MSDNDLEVGRLQGELKGVKDDVGKIHKDYKDVLERLREVEQHLGQMPSKDDMELIRQMAKAHAAKRQFWEKLATTIVTRGAVVALGVMVVIFWDGLKAKLGIV